MTGLVCHVIAFVLKQAWGHVVSVRDQWAWSTERDDQGYVTEDEIDQLLKKRDGLIQRDREPQL